MFTGHPSLTEVLLALDGSVCAERTVRILDHLAICSRCRTRADEVESMMSTVAAALKGSVTGDELIAQQGRRLRLESRLRELYADPPRVFVAEVNGRPIAEFAVIYRTNCWTFEVDSGIEHVEVTCEQGRCLLAMNMKAHSQCGASRATLASSLGGGRYLQLDASRNVPATILRLSYCDLGATVQ